MKGNKVDSQSAVSEETLKESLGLKFATTGKETTKTEGIRPLEVFMCSVLNRFGYDKAFKWIAKNY